MPPRCPATIAVVLQAPDDLLWHIARMRPSICAASVASLLTMLAACASAADQGPGSSPVRASSPSTSTSVATVPTTFATESARTIRQCGAKREFDTAGVPNPCEQAEHLHSLFKRNEEWSAREGFTVHVGSIGKCGIRLTVYGDVEAARETFGGDPLIYRITSNDEGFPPDC